MRVCFDCGVVKELEDFPYRNKQEGTRHNRCKACLRRLRTKYRPNKGGKKCTPLKVRFMSKVRIAQSGCWEWTGGLNPAGYGRFACKTESGWIMELAHRYSYSFFVGPLTDGLYVCHRCDNPKCVNPQHLFLGTQQNNISDAKKKGRIPSGDAHYSRQRPHLVASGDNHWTRRRLAGVNRGGDGKFTV